MEALTGARLTAIHAQERLIRVLRHLSRHTALPKLLLNHQDLDADGIYIQNISKKISQRKYFAVVSSK